MAVDDDIEHRTALRSGSRVAPLALLAALVVAAIAVLVCGDSAAPPREGQPVTPSTPTSETLTTTRPPRVPPVLAVADGGGGPVPTSASSDDYTRFPPPGSTFEALQATPLAVDGRVVVLADGGQLLAGAPGGVFERVGPAEPISQVVASNEPGHVWAGVTEGELALVDLDGGEPSVRLPIGDDRVLGPASFGVVTVAADGTVAWRRPSFDATPLSIPADRTPLDAGGELVLVEVPGAGDGLRRFETWSIVDDRAVQAFVVRASDRPALLAPDGGTVALPERFGFVVLDAATSVELGVLPPSGLPGVAPVWVGGDHFAIPSAAHLVQISGSVRHRPRWPVIALAEASPSG